MSNIYIQEPPTSGKVLLKTTAGDIDIELWTREAPKTCRNFIQLCMEGYYNETIFHRVIADFIAQGGDPNGDGTGGESIYGAPFKDEFHSRLRFCRRGLIASANSGKDDNGSQFFFTLGDASELQNKHTIFGKVTGDTLFNMLKLGSGETDANECPLYPYKILKTEVLVNPFDDIVPRNAAAKEKKSNAGKKAKEKGVKNFGLLSFGAEAEEDEEEVDKFGESNSGKAKSLHDVVDDPLLSKETQALEVAEEDEAEPEATVAPENTQTTEEDMKKIRKKLAGTAKKDPNTSDVAEKEQDVKSDSDSDEYVNEIQRERKEKRKKEAEQIRTQIEALKKEYKAGRQTKDQESGNEAKQEKRPLEGVDNEMIQSYLFEQKKYSSMKKDIAQKGDAREQFTLQLLSKFKSKLADARKETVEKQAPNTVSDEVEADNESWLTHTLCFEDQGEVLAKDASKKQDDWYDAYDPRNPLNKRKRGERSESGKKGHTSKRERR